jgi:NTP pyrophosphatase (non-canonical NTP hydrolase)
MRQVNDHQEECLNILQEECAEVIQIASKIKRFGIHNKKPGAELNNLQNLEMELGDVLAMIDLCREAGIGITDEGLKKAKLAKKERLSLWMHTWAETKSSTK